MNYSLADLQGLVQATLLYVPLLLLPGTALAVAFAKYVTGESPGRRDWPLAVVVAFALLPALDSGIVRFLGLWPAVLANLLLAAAGLAIIVRQRPSPRWRGGWLLALAWFAAVVVALVDVDWQGRLYQSLVAYDMVKHAATANAIAATGAPPIDPFFLRPGASGYYYFFYTPAALALTLGDGLVDARAAIGGLIVWMGPALYGLAMLVLDRTGLACDRNRRRLRVIVVLLLAATGLDILPVVASHLRNGLWYPQIDWWNDEVTGWIGSLVWVPHHVNALVASWLGLLVLAGEIDCVRAGARARPLALLVASVAFVSALGTSVWVTFTAALTVLAWLGLLARERLWPAVAALLAVGVSCVILAAPYLADLIGNRSEGGFPIGFGIRAFYPWDRQVSDPIIRLIGRVVLLPLNYFLEFGVLLVGTVLFWRRRHPAKVHVREAARVLTLSALVSLFVMTFLRSTIINNDLGWRAALFLQLAALVWTAVAVGERIPAGAPRFRPRPLALGFALLLALGYAGTLYSFIGWRGYGALGRESMIPSLNAEPRTDRELRTAYAWLDRHLPEAAVLQHNPLPDRVYDFGLYGRHRVAIADRDANLFGASRAAVERRLGVLGPLFVRRMPAAAARARAAAEGVDYLVATIDDPVWRDPQSWVWQAPPTYASPRVRVIATGHLT